MRKRIVSLFLALILLITPLAGCKPISENEDFIAAIAESTGLSEAEIRGQLRQTERDMEFLKREFDKLSDEALAALLKELGINLDPSLPGVRDAIWNWIESFWGKKDETPDIPQFAGDSVITAAPIPEDEVVETLNLSFSEFDPLRGYVKTMTGAQVPPESEDNSEPGGGKGKQNFVPKIELKSSNSDRNAAAMDAVVFFMDWIGNSTEVTLLRVKKAADGRVNVEYGSPIELPYSGKRTTLSSIYAKGTPLQLLNSAKNADRDIRSMFGLSGNGTYSMTMKFGRVYIGECGYRMVLDGDTLYQIPIIHEDTAFNVYFKEEGKKFYEPATFLFDAADELRQLKIPVPKEEADKVLQKLRENGVID